ncbi:MAG: hypothetical protein IT416_03000 [Candidatus Pacebacteria bacterium]|nr:hypothetical protein [Candidatus Paceibacterota bacterium]
MNIPRYWRNREQALRLAGIEKVDQANGIGLAHMRSSQETIDQVKKLRAMLAKQAEQDEAELVALRLKITQTF